MRRIIERVVTVVTTTTWKISWEADSSQAGISHDLTAPEVLSETVYDTQARSDLTETKEVDFAEREVKTTGFIAEETPHESYPYQSKIERKSKS